LDCCDNGVEKDEAARQHFAIYWRGTISLSLQSSLHFYDPPLRTTTSHWWSNAAWLWCDLFWFICFLKSGRVGRNQKGALVIMASTASATGSTHSLASGGGPTSQGNNNNANNGGMEELLPLVLQLTNAEQVQYYEFMMVAVLWMWMRVAL
jgi:hypothetical protein